ncbi:gamma-glutamyltransferase [Sandarakinorhabdus rubra]|uniref:gamma-glutamyltransferase n=1 Tax=Sandarakinorhabdus rubra TaxID=2672568 RepID=UPI0013DCC015|nr:gamma-glutamyltransferase [Sandarakinorhabdus rubra]
MKRRALAVLAAMMATAAPAQQFDPLPGQRANGWAGQTRSEVVASEGMVATSHPMAVQAGIDILKAGGNAFDAAVAVAAVLNVVEPGSAGIGGDGFVLAWSAAEKKMVALDGSGRAPTGASIERLKRLGHARVPGIGIESAVVPGAVDMWDVLLKRYGSRDFRAVLEPAARIAETGFGISERIGRDWADDGQILNSDPETARVHLPGGKAPPLYSRFTNPDLGKAFRLLQQGGRDAFYKGPIAQAIIRRAGELGGQITQADFDRVHAEWVTPVSTSFMGHEVLEMPPSTQGFAVLEMVNIVEQCAPVLGVDVVREGPRSANYWHLMVEAKKLAYADLERFNGDPAITPVDTGRLTSKAYAKSLCGRIDMKTASAVGPASQPVGGTVYLAVADRFGNMVSFIYSIYGEFGSGVTVPGYGFVLNNRAAQFNMDPASPNAIAPGKRPFYTLIPGFVTKDGQPSMAFGLMSGDQQAQGHAQVLMNMLVFGGNPQAASDAARFNHSQRRNRLTLEGALYDAVGAELKARGHDVVQGNGDLMGGYQAILRDPASGLYRGASDHRKDGMAAGY